MADAPHSKCGGKPCRFKSDCRYHFSQIFGSAFFVVAKGILVSHRRIGFGVYYENGFDQLRKRLIIQSFSPNFLDMERPTDWPAVC